MPARRLRPALVAAATLALGAGLLAASPAHAAAGSLTISSSNVAFNSNRDAQVRATCSNKGTCRGTLALEGSPTVTKSYSLGKGKSAWLDVRVHANHPANPHAFPASSRRLVIKQSGAGTKYKTVAVEKRVYEQKITGTVTGVGPTPQGVAVKLWGSVSGRGTAATKVAKVANPRGGTYEFTVKLGPNNTSSSGYRLEVTGTSEGEYRSWWWRGGNRAPQGGGRYIRDATVVKVGKSGYTADVRYGNITGTASGAREVTVAAPPPSFSGGSRVLRSLDYDSCANIFGTSPVSSGVYDVGFLPANPSATDYRYMVAAESSSSSNLSAFHGRTETRFGSCLDIIGYTNRSRSDLIALAGPAPTVAKNIALRPGSSNVHIRGAKFRFAKTGSDRHTTVRAYRPGRKVLDSPVVQRASVNSSSGNATYSGLAPGKYWVEIGRRTGCSTWVPSRFTNNRAYHKGLERGGERWKSVSGSKAEVSKSISMGFPKSGRKPPKGYKGWSYRDYCRADGVGGYKLVDISDDRTATLTPTVAKGATISGRVTRTGGRTNKEMLVEAYSTGGTLVRRTAITNGSGKFTIRGLATGTYRIRVNGDSWRGIGRTASGPTSKKVKAGKSYSVGTLKFKG